MPGDLGPLANVGLLAHAELTGEAVEARGAGLAYRARCLVRCHRLAVATSALLLALSIGGTVGLSLHTARSERRERAKADQVKEFGFTPVATVEEAIEKAFLLHGRDASILCMPKGCYIFQKVQIKA